jgi:hypothetical protein
MTTDHPDEELLSALLDARRFAVDGQPAEDVTDHVTGCEICQHRLARLAEVVAAVAAPVPPPPEAVREAAISRALATETARGEEAVGGQVARIDRRLAMPRGRQLARVLGAAAIVLALLGALPVLLSKSSSPKSASTASRATGTLAAPATTAAGASGTTTFGAATAPGPQDRLAAGADLGAQSDLVQLAHQVDQSLAAASTTSPQASSATKNSSVGVGPAALPCEAVAAGSAGAGGGAGSATPIYAASLTWKGTPADVYAFTTPAGRQAVVVSRADCRILQVLAL